MIVDEEKPPIPFVSSHSRKGEPTRHGDTEQRRAELSSHKLSRSNAIMIHNSTTQNDANRTRSWPTQNSDTQTMQLDAIMTHNSATSQNTLIAPFGFVSFANSS